MNLGHKMQQRETIQNEETIKYTKCIRCGAVIFEKGDDYANLYCSKAVNDREELRKQL